MKRRHTLLPPSLNGLKVFESAARHLSFTLAAEELNVTQSAVSRQIRQLEEHIGFSLFIRHHRALELTKEGKEIAQVLTRQYSELNRVLKQLKMKESSTLRVKVAMSFAVRWLIPRLHSFKARYPDLDIVLSSSLAHSSEEMNLDEDDYDIAIFNVQKTPNSQHSYHFIRKEYLAPVYSGLLTHSDTPLTVKEMLRYPRLHPTSDQSDWKIWLARNHLKNAVNHAGITFNTLDMALTSCLAGQGVTITDLMLVVNELQQGFLKLPQSAVIVANSDWEYYYQTHAMQTSAESDAVTNFINWLVSEQEKEKTVLFSMAEQYGWQVLTD